MNSVEFRVRSIGSAALGLAYIALGTLDAVVIEGLGPWDVAAGSLIVQEAGGAVIDTKGKERSFESRVPLEQHKKIVLNTVRFVIC